MFGNLSKDDWESIVNVLEDKIHEESAEMVVWSHLRNYAVTNLQLRLVMDGILSAEAFGPVRAIAALHRDMADEAGGPLADFWNDVAIFCDDAINTRLPEGG